MGSQRGCIATAVKSLVPFGFEERFGLLRLEEERLVVMIGGAIEDLRTTVGAAAAV